MSLLFNCTLKDKTMSHLCYSVMETVCDLLLEPVNGWTVTNIRSNFLQLYMHTITHDALLDSNTYYIISQFFF